ncbi:MAG TPA: aldo/keto reductase [Anaeromyxobacteraceae bacterium]|nr:aldo/keto reductase [Anaeromyxobacteraceae bacterium]
MEQVNRSLTRRRFLQGLGATTVAPFVLGAGAAAPETLIEKPIPSTGVRIPVIGLGTSGTFDVPPGSGRSALAPVLQAFFDRGGTLIDSSPMYGAAEEVVGQLLRTTRHGSVFAATKVWTDGKQAGIEQMEQSRRLWGVPRLDLMQIHNLRDWQIHVGTLKDWKSAGKIRYLGVTTSHGRMHDELEQALRKEPFDFVQLSYNLEDREVERRLLPLAVDRGIAVLVNRPFQRGGLFGKVRGKPLPPWAKDLGIASWAQYFLKFAVSHPAVTCAIPATSKVEHMEDDLAAARGRLPDAAERERMVRFVEAA